MRWVDASHQELLEKPSPYGIIDSWIEQGQIHYRFRGDTELFGVLPEFLMQLDFPMPQTQPIIRLGDVVLEYVGTSAEWLVFIYRRKP